MIRGRTVLFATASLGIALSSAALVPEAGGNPYASIVDRNVFQLKPLIVTNTPPPDPPKPASRLTLTGISTSFGKKRVFLTAQVPPRPPEPPKTENYMLSEGQLDGGIEVVSIDEKAGVVKVKNNGISETLDFANNGAKLTSSAPLAAGMLPQPTLNRPGFPAGVPGPGMRTLPQPAINPGTAAPNAGTSSFGSGRTSAIAQPQFQANVTPEVQTILIEAQRMDLQQQGRTEEAALFPVTEMTPAIQDENFIPAPGP